MKLEIFVATTTAGILLVQGTVNLQGMLEVNSFNTDTETAIGLKHFYEPKEFKSISNLFSCK